jgi:hypothetical protein
MTQNKVAQTGTGRYHEERQELAKIKYKRLWEERRD